MTKESPPPTPHQNGENTKNTPTQEEMWNELEDDPDKTTMLPEDLVKELFKKPLINK